MGRWGIKRHGAIPLGNGGFRPGADVGGIQGATAEDRVGRPFKTTAHWQVVGHCRRSYSMQEWQLRGTQLSLRQLQDSTTDFQEAVRLEPTLSGSTWLREADVEERGSNRPAQFFAQVRLTAGLCLISFRVVSLMKFLFYMEHRA